MRVITQRQFIRLANSGNYNVVFPKYIQPPSSCLTCTVVRLRPKGRRPYARITKRGEWRFMGSFGKLYAVRSDR